MTKPSTRANSRRPKSAGARNRGVQGTAGQQLISGYGDLKGTPVAASAVRADSFSLLGVALAGLQRQESSPPVCTEAILSRHRVFQGERRRGRAKPSGNRG